MKAVGDHILIMPDKTEEKVGSILIPVRTVKAIVPITGTVVDVFDEAEISVGDKVFYNPTYGAVLDESGVVSLNREFIHAIVN